MITLIFLSATYTTSGSFKSLINESKGFVNFLQNILIVSGLFKKSKYFMITLVADNTKPGLAWLSLGDTLSKIFSHSVASAGVYIPKASKI